MKDGEPRRAYDIEQKVIDAAEKGEFSNVSGRGEQTRDAWKELRGFLVKARDPKFSLGKMPLDVKKWYADMYRRCKAQLLASTDIVITTTGNARCAEILEQWLGSQEEFGVPCKGVIVLCDEAFKDAELCTWNAICAPGKHVKGVFLFGDEM